ncbi:hypothetical protein J6590_005765 [Homalodisca vitripennis]|nr:hypothetical protein J6590_005765 [Homalodisca vitripennis]
MSAKTESQEQDEGGEQVLHEYPKPNPTLTSRSVASHRLIIHSEHDSLQKPFRHRPRTVEAAAVRQELFASS